MAGELVPLVMLPRYSAFTGDGEFTTIAMDVTEYQNAILNCWRGKLNGTTFTIALEESTDGVTWVNCTGGAPADPGENTETQMVGQLKKRWFRVKAKMLGTSSSTVTCWAIGFLEQRER